MKNSTIIGFWLITVILGSILFGYIAFINSGINEDVFVHIGLSMFFSITFSIPAVIAFILFNNKYLKIIGHTKEFHQKMLLMHLIVGIIYFFIGLLGGVIANMNPLTFLVLLVCYLPFGLILWNLKLRKHQTMSK